MAENPYILSGFGEGFERGLRLIALQEQRKVAAAAAAREAEIHGLKVQESKLGLEKSKFDLETAREKAKRDPLNEASERELRAAQAAKARAEASEATEKIKQSREEAAGLKYEGLVENAGKMSEHLIGVMERNPNWGQEAAQLRVALESNQVNNQVVDLGRKWLAETYDHKIKAGLGNTISDSTAKEQGVAFGSKIINKELKTFYKDPQSNSVVMILDVTVQQPDGSIKHYDAPVTKGRTDGPEDEVQVVSFQDLHNVFKSATQIEIGLQGIEKETGRNRKQLLLDMKAGQIKAGRKRTGAAAKPPAEIAANQAIGDALLPNEPDPRKRLLAGEKYRREAVKSKEFEKAVASVIKDEYNDQEGRAYTEAEARQLVLERLAAAGGGTAQRGVEIPEGMRVIRIRPTE